MKFLRRLSSFFRRGKLDRDMAEEMRFHLEQRKLDGIGDGMTPTEAGHAARRKFGNTGLIQETARSERGGVWLENLGKDLRQGVRFLVRAPGFSLAAVASLAIGIGATTAMFSVIDEVMLRPLPFPEAGRLVTLWSENPRLGLSRQTSGLANIADWRQAARSVEDIAIYDPVSVTVVAGEPRRTSLVLVSANLADVLRIQPQLGRMFTAEEAARREPVAVISHAAWQRHHGGTSDILGGRVTIDGRVTEIVGVLQESTVFPDGDAEFWIPESFARGYDQAVTARGAGSWRAVARLVPGTSLAAAGAEFSRIAAALAREYPLNDGLDVAVVPLDRIVVGPDVRRALLLLLGAVGAVLLIACSNVGNLLLARGITRQREFAVRLSIGATRARLVAQLLVENLVLCSVSAALGLGLATAALQLLRPLAPTDIPRLENVGVDPGMAAFAGLLALVSACVFGLLPALQATRRNPLAMLREGGRTGSDGPRGRRLRDGLVVAEIALAVVLFSGAALLLRSFARLVAVDPGFTIENVLFANVRLPADRPEEDSVVFARETIDRVAALPGISSAAVAEEMLLGEQGEQRLTAEGTDSAAPREFRGPLGSDAVTPDYFRTMNVQLREGRPFTEQDNASAPAVAVVNATLAQRLWPETNAVGRRLRRGGANSTAPWVTVIGVVDDQRRQGLDRAPIAQVFWPLAQQPSRAMNLVARTAVDPASLAALVRRTVQSVDPTVPIGPLTTLREQIDRTMAPRRFNTTLLAAFAGVALVLAGAGIFGLMHYSVARRSQEIGIRTALGATSAQVVAQILREGLRLAATGVVIGIAASIALGRIFAGLLFEVSPLDPFSLLAAAAALTGLAALACLLPALRASRIDPVIALRAE